MTPFIAQAIERRELGLALHYPFLHAAIVGLNAKRTLEFGAGGSTRVILEALQTKAMHISVSTEYSLPDHVYEAVVARGEDRPEWAHRAGLSDEHRDIAGPFDLVLHDGSHATDVVARDIAWAWPLLRPFGLLLVHDSQHSYCGAEVRSGIVTGLLAAHARYSVTTLPYGFGLTIIRKEEPGEGAVNPTPAKVGSVHTTELVTFKEQTA